MKHSTLLLFLIILLSSCTPSRLSEKSYSQETTPISATAVDNPMPGAIPSIYPAPSTKTPTVIPSLIAGASARYPAPVIDPKMIEQFKPSPTVDLRYSPTPYPTATFDPNFTPVPARNPGFVLPGDLQIEEYLGNKGNPTLNGYAGYGIVKLIVFRHPEGGKRVAIRGDYYNEIEDGPFQVVYEHMSENGFDYRFNFLFNGRKNLALECTKEFFFPVTYAYTSDHWYFSTRCLGKSRFSTFADGVSLDQAKGYTQALGVQLLDGKLLYLYEKDGTAGVSYNGIDTALDYDRIATHWCYESCWPYPAYGYEHMIIFAAFKGEQLYYVAIGHFKPVAHQ